MFQGICELFVVFNDAFLIHFLLVQYFYLSSLHSEQRFLEFRSDSHCFSPLCPHWLLMASSSGRSNKSCQPNVFRCVLLFIPFFVYLLYSLVNLKDRINNAFENNWKQYRNVVFEHRYFINVSFLVNFVTV